MKFTWGDNEAEPTCGKCGAEVLERDGSVICSRCAKNFGTVADVREKCRKAVFVKV